MPENDRVQEIAARAAPLAGAERAAFLTDSCGDDEQLRVEVERLLETGAASTVEGDVPRAGSAPALATGTRVDDLTVEHVIGSGGMGVVYAARDGAGRRVALKVFHPHLVAHGGAFERFVREAELGQRVRHENVVRTLRAGRATADGRTQHYLVMEHVRGRTLHGLRQGLGTIPESLLREIARQAVAGLAAIHAAGIVHRDVKPENLLLTDDHRLRISDLGVAKLVEASEALTDEGQFVGSLLYASPEQCEGRGVGPASDLYSLGVVLYELATGRNPFRADGAAAIVLAHLTRTPPPVTELHPEISPFFAEVVSTLLEREPARRFASADVLAAVLDEGESGAWWERRRAARASRLPRVPVAQRTAFHGRDAEMRALERAVAAVREGRGQVVVLVGEEGIGKSRLVAELLRAHATEDVELLYGAYDAFGGVDAVRAAVAARIDAPDGRVLLARLLHDLPDAVPALTAWAHGAAAPDGRALHPDARDAFVARLLRRLAAERPVVWVVEDVHAASPESLRLPLALARAAAGRRVLVVITARGLSGDLSAALSRVSEVRRLPLARASAEDLLGALREEFADDSVAARLGPQIARLAGGVPLFAFEIVRGMIADGRLERGADGRLHEITWVDDIEVPASLRELVLGRLAGLERGEREALDVAALLGPVFAPEVLAGVLGEPLIRVLETLGRLERLHGLVRSEGRALRFDHALVREVLLDALPEPLALELHRLVADALLAAAGDPAAPDGALAAEVFHHRIRSSAPAAAADVLGAAIRHLEAQHFLEAMVDAGTRALELLDLTARRRANLRDRLGKRLWLLGRASEAEAALRAGVTDADASGDPEVQARLRVSLGFHLLLAGSYSGALDVFEDVEPSVRALGRPELQGELLAGRGQVLWCLGRYPEAKACHEEVLRIGRETPLPSFEARGCSDLAVVCHELGELARAETLLRRAAELERALGDIRNEATVVSNLANAIYDQGRAGEALVLYRQALDVYRRVGDRVGEAVAQVNIGEVQLRLGAPAQARAAYDACLRITRETAAPRVEAYAHHGLGLLARSLGDEAAAERHLEDALAMRSSIGHAQGLCETQVELGALLVDRGGAERGRELLEAAREGALAMGDRGLALLALLRLALLDGDRSGIDAAVHELAAARDRLRAAARLEVLELLFRATGDAAYLREARDLLDRARAAAPSDRRETMVTNVPLHRRILEATQGGPSGGEGRAP